LEKKRGRAIHIGGRPDSLVLTGLLDHLHIPHTRPQKLLDESVLPLRLISMDRDVAAACRDVRRLLTANMPEAGRCLPAVEWVISELLDNVLLHADAEVPGVIAARYRQNQRLLELTVVDVGRGIRASLSERVALFSDGHAITEALRRGVTRNEDVGQGNGLAGAREIVRMNGGGLEIWSGTAVFRAEGETDKGFVVGPPVPGTGVMLSLRTDRALDLEGTWIAQYRSTRFGTEAGEIEASARLRVAAETESTGTRGAARLLREKVRGELASRDTVTLDFTGTSTVSSSFLDELFGRLGKELGAAELRRRIRVDGAPRALRSQAEAVLEQRLGEPAEDGSD